MDDPSQHANQVANAEIARKEAKMHRQLTKSSAKGLGLKNNKWDVEYEGKDAKGTLERGERLHKLICSACHSTDGSARVGPTFKGRYGTEVEHTDGTKAVIDDAYIVEAIRAPSQRVTKGYPPAMPPQPLDDEDVASLLLFMKSVK